jgi:exodeoxyribonuclease VII large subunit
MKLICFGRISVYEKDGRYQLCVWQVEPKGIGSLQLALEQLKQKLEKEGLFSAEHKRPLPYLASKIGVVTSLSGAAIRDILKVLDRRFSAIPVVINPVRVQGEGAGKEIASAIEDFNRLNEDSPIFERIEVMIVGRGGGSIEDLWAFNEEIVAHAIYNSKIPIISAVGHERDWTIADLVADVRAATPSVAAELALPKKEDLREKLHSLIADGQRSFLDITFNLREAIEDLAHRLTLSMQNSLKLNASELASSQKKLALLNPSVLIPQYKTKIADLSRQIYTQLTHLIKLKEAKFKVAIEKLTSLSPLNILSRGYSITFKMPQGQILKDVKFIQIGDTVKTKLHKGEILSRVIRDGSQLKGEPSPNDLRTVPGGGNNG